MTEGCQTGRMLLSAIAPDWGYIEAADSFSDLPISPWYHPCYAASRIGSSGRLAQSESPLPKRVLEYRGDRI